MPGDNFLGFFHWGSKLTNVTGSQVHTSRLDDMVRRILAAWYYLDQDKGYPSPKVSTIPLIPTGPDVQSDHKIVARAIARDGIILLKNDDNILPLRNPKSLAIIGQDAIVNPSGPNACLDRGCDTGTLAVGYGSGTAEFPVSYDRCSF
jgi:beta-glucosidase